MGKNNDFTKEGEQITLAGDIAAAKGDVRKTEKEVEKLHREGSLAREDAARCEGQESPSNEMAFVTVDAVLEGLRAVGVEQELAAGKPYLVMGARLYCSCGSHVRRLNLPLDHGVYIRGLPMIHEEDCLVGDGKNITTFGVCCSEGHPAWEPLWKEALEKSTRGAVCVSLSQTIFGKPADTAFKDTVDHKILLQREDGKNVRGYPCTPCIVGCWRDVNRTQKIVRNGTDGMREQDKLSAVTTDSFLVCAYGGLIEPLSSGQEEGQW